MNDPFGIAIGVAVAVVLLPVFIQVAVRQYKITRGRQIAGQNREQQYIDIYEQSKRPRPHADLGARSPGEGTHIGPWPP